LGNDIPHKINLESAISILRFLLIHPYMGMTESFVTLCKIALRNLFQACPYFEWSKLVGTVAVKSRSRRNAAFCRWILPMLIIAHLANARNERALVREQEEVLVRAVNARNKAALSALTDKNFHLSWSSGSALQNFRTEMSREEWLDRLRQLRVASYQIKISEVSWAERKTKPSTEAPLAVYVTLQEFWILLSLQGQRIEKQVKTLDFWMQQQGAWKLVTRLCQSDAP
jgi:hypothetical protein